MVTTSRNVRIDDETWESVKRIAAARGETVSDVVRAALARYVRRNLSHILEGEPEND